MKRLSKQDKIKVHESALRTVSINRFMDDIRGKYNE